MKHTIDWRTRVCKTCGRTQLDIDLDRLACRAEITLLDEFRIAIIAQTRSHEAFWADMAAEWWRDWKKRRIRKALVALHYGP